MNDQALETIKQGLAIEEENEDLTKLYEESKREYEDDHKISEDDPSKKIFNRLENWLKEGGSNYEKLKIRYYTPIYRGVHAARNIKAGEEILYVPKDQIITLEMAMDSPIGKKMMHHGLRQSLLSPKHSFLTTFILQEEERGAESFFHPFIDVLPKSFENFPIFFDDEEKKELEGSPFLKQVEEKIEDVKTDYDSICDKVPEYAKYDFRRFS